MSKANIDFHIDFVREDGGTEYDVEGIPCCPKCGSKAYISKDVVDGFYFGWSVGCPRFCHNDSIHNTDSNTPEDKLYAIHYLNSREECIDKWKIRVKSLMEENDV